MNRNTLIKKCQIIVKAFNNLGYQFTRIEFLHNDKKFLIGNCFCFEMTLNDANKMIKSYKESVS